MNRIFVIADLHLGHKKEDLLLDRGFHRYNIYETNLILAWNRVVNPKDTVYILGDVAFGKENLNIIGRLNGYKHLILGNHDTYAIEEYKKYFNKILSSIRVKNCILSHIPIHQDCFRGADLNIHGHLHSGKINDNRYICVSVEHVGLSPKLLSEIIFNNPIKNKK